jgi:NADH-quinone oxidoreductase subunit J
VVLLRDIFRAALSLVLCFLTVAGIYVTLSADFLAVVQVLIYVGAISVLIILAIMLTRDVQRGSPSNRLRIPAFLVAILFLAVVGFAVLNTMWTVSAVPPLEPTTAALAIKLFGEGGFILAVEIAALLVLAAILGAIVLVREK